MLEAVELLAGLAIEILAVYDEETFLDVGIVLEERGRLERGKRLAAAGGVPDVAIAGVVLDALDDLLHGIDLVGPHNHELLLAGDEHHVAADRLGQRTLLEEAGREIIEMDDLSVGLVGELIDG